MKQQNDENVRKLFNEIGEMKKGMAKLNQKIVYLEKENVKVLEENRELKEKIAAMKAEIEILSTPKRIKLRRPLPPELLYEMHKCLPLDQQIELIRDVPSRVIVLNNGKRVQRKLQHIRKALNSKSMAGSGPPKEWHRYITPDLRNHLVGKFIKALDPNRNLLELIGNSRIRGLIFRAYLRKMRNMEKECFEVAPDKEAYYYMLAVKIYKIQKEVGLKKINFWALLASD